MSTIVTASSTTLLLLVVAAALISNNVSAFLVTFSPSSSRIVAAPHRHWRLQSKADDYATLVDEKTEDSVAKLTVVVAGATGYIGRAVVRESVSRGYRTIALVRSNSNSSHEKAFRGATVMAVDVTNLANITSSLHGCDVHTIVSCLASPTGLKKQVQEIDYQASLNCLLAGQALRAKHYILLSAYCVSKPLLELQRAKLRMERRLQTQTQLTWSIVRPTAFFKSISGQLEGIQHKNTSYVLFGNGRVTRCNPIGETDLANYMLDCIERDDRNGKILNVGGPDPPLTNKMLGEMMFRAIGKRPKFVYAPTWIFDYIINGTQLLANVLDNDFLRDAAETGRIGKYYAVEDMCTTDPDEKFGTITVQDHYDTIARQGQDPFTPIRATAVIAKFLERLPATISVAIPIGLVATHPKAIESVVGPMERLDFSVLIATLSGHF